MSERFQELKGYLHDALDAGDSERVRRLVQELKRSKELGEARLEDWPDILGVSFDELQTAIRHADAKERSKPKPRGPLSDREAGRVKPWGWTWEPS